ncbi:recombining binding protein suppressor of hairless-like protein isoform X1 [Hippocampus comes]|uniref:recombining binding protein suppressor of hairless-like protein isoform X1 n=1 Tax=Hippocampus comes TaxID=109280 RepID=UPI00094ED144|nr:PREDICTED: recombining binding protein suppressor of hairless-like protein isoform X1 [Hippocampus comes]
MCVDTAALTHSDAHKLNFETLPNMTGMLACSKSLFISDQDKRKHFRLLLRLFLEVGSVRQEVGSIKQEVGSFHSRLIKVISKPSQKRQTMKNADLCISACSRVALFNRLRSQTVNTRYLAVEGGAFVASARQWTAFTITLVEEQHAERQGDFVLSEGFICYGSVVQLVCTESGLTLPPMVIRKVNKQHAVLSVDEPVSQLHKCALEMRDTPQAFLAVANDAVVLHQATPSTREAGRVLLNDGSCWTVIGVEVVEFGFCQADAAYVRTPVTPFPDVTGLEVSGGGHAATLEVHGENLGPHLKVCFGRSEVDTVFKSTKCLVCVVPDVCALWCGCRGNGSCHSGSGAVTVPISLRRPCDGVVYRTAFSFTYTPELERPRRPTTPAGGVFVHDARGTPAATRHDDALLDSIHHEFTRTNFHLFLQP